MQNQSYAPRHARVTVTTRRGGEAPITYAFEQHRMRLRLRQGGKQFSNLRVEIFGAPLDAMNQIARLWLDPLTPSNADSIQVEVGAPEGNYVLWFTGTIAWASVDASSMPFVKLVIEANAAFDLMNQPGVPYANTGPVSLRTALTEILQPAGYTLRYAESAPEYQMSNIRVQGSPFEQLAALLSQYPTLTWDVNLTQLTVRDVRAPFGSDSIRIAVDTGMQRAPIYSTSGVVLATLFNPMIRPGVALDIETNTEFINRTQWVASVLVHALDVQLPGGQWTTEIAANAFGPKASAT